jgi:hypothetical protein
MTEPPHIGDDFTKAGRDLTATRQLPGLRQQAENHDRKSSSEKLGNQNECMTHRSQTSGRRERCICRVERVSYFIPRLPQVVGLSDFDKFGFSSREVPAGRVWEPATTIKRKITT